MMAAASGASVSARTDGERSGLTGSRSRTIAVRASVIYAHPTDEPHPTSPPYESPARKKNGHAAALSSSSSHETRASSPRSRECRAVRQSHRSSTRRCGGAAGRAVDPEALRAARAAPRRRPPSPADRPARYRPLVAIRSSQYGAPRTRAASNSAL